MKINYTVTYIDVNEKVQEIHPETREDLDRIVKKIIDGGLELLGVVTETID